MHDSEDADFASYVLCWYQFSSNVDCVFSEDSLFGVFFFLVLTILPRWCKISSPYLVPVPNF